MEKDRHKLLVAVLAVLLGLGLVGPAGAADPSPVKQPAKKKGEETLPKTPGAHLPLDLWVGKERTFELKPGGAQGYPGLQSLVKVRVANTGPGTSPTNTLCVVIKTTADVPGLPPAGYTWSSQETQVPVLGPGKDTWVTLESVKVGHVSDQYYKYFQAEIAVDCKATVAEKNENNNKLVRTPKAR